MRYLLLLVALLLSITGYTQDQSYYYLKNNGSFVKYKDSAEVIRIVTEPQKGETLYTVAEYFISGKQKRLFKSGSIYPIRIEGPMLTFYENGKRRFIEEYKEGRNVGSAYYYYPNGRVYMVKEFLPQPVTTPYAINKLSVAYTITEAYDSLGTATVISGNGPCTIYTDDFKGIAEQGEIKDGEREGIWKGTHKPTNSTFEEEYSSGILKLGRAEYEGHVVTYIQRSTSPEFVGGDAQFGRFIGRQIRYPAEEREKGIQGRVIVSFDVEKDGQLGNFQLVSSVSKGLDQEALRALKNSPKWKPATLYGQPIKIHYTVPITFALGGRGY